MHDIKRTLCTLRTLCTRLALPLFALPLLALPLLAGCADGGEGEAGGDSFDNQAACEAFVDAYNDLECVDSTVSVDPDQACVGYTDTTVDCSNIFACWTDNMVCEDLGGVSVPANYVDGCPTVCE